MTKMIGKINLKWIVFGTIFAIIVAILTLSIGIFVKYQNDMKTASVNEGSISVVISSGSNLNEIANKLAEKKVISSNDAKLSFKIHAMLNDKNNIKAGTYVFSPGLTIPKVLEIINNGQIEESFDITFLPGGTISMAKKELAKHGFTEEQIKKALEKDYSKEFPKLFAGKPMDSDLEGFMFGETYRFKKGTNVENILKAVFKEMQKYIVDLKLEERFKAQDLTLYEGITFASIVQKEVVGSTDQRAVSGVFFNRLHLGMNLGSDVTYQYIADKTGVERSTIIDSPYNLRVHTGLTPTPIATPGASAMKSVADPEKNEYLFFLSGDDDKTYFGRTDAEHQKNIVDHCKKKCLII